MKYYIISDKDIKKFLSRIYHESSLDTAVEIFLEEKEPVDLAAGGRIVSTLSNAKIGDTWIDPDFINIVNQYHNNEIEVYIKRKWKIEPEAAKL